MTTTVSLEIVILFIFVTTSPGVAYDTVDFCVTHLNHLCIKTNLFTKYFPSLLKVRYAST